VCQRDGVGVSGLTGHAGAIPIPRALEALSPVFHTHAQGARDLGDASRGFSRHRKRPEPDGGSRAHG